jgi:hypothetical protein
VHLKRPTKLISRLSNSSQFRRRISLQSDYVDYCLNCIEQSVDSWTDSNLEKMVRLQQVVENIAEAFPINDGSAPRNDKTYAYLLTNEMRPIRDQADKICESFNHHQMQSGESPSSCHSFFDLASADTHR